MKVDLKDDKKIFNSAWDAMKQLKQLENNIKLPEAQLMEKELQQ